MYTSAKYVIHRGAQATRQGIDVYKTASITRLLGVHGHCHFHSQHVCL